MNFTREPIIETVITPREGCKLVVRSSKGNGQEDYFVDAVEVVSFGHSFFFRSSERPKPFLVPVSDYEILELKETRMVLKNVSTDRSIKISGGREAPPRSQGEQREPRPQGEQREEEPRQQQQQDRSQLDRKRDKRRRGRRGRDRHDQQQYPQEAPMQHHDESRAPVDSAEAPSQEMPGSEEVKAPSFISKLFPPPPTLIKETLSRYKPAESDEGTFQVEEKTTFEETIFEHPEQKNESDDEEDRFEE